jgi:hypothetical protein
MAIGDDALAAGMDLVLGSELANTLDTIENQTRDYIAQRTYPVQPIEKGGTAATTAAAARINLGLADVSVANAPGTIPIRDENTAISVGWVYMPNAPALPQHATNKAYVDARLAAAREALGAALEKIEDLAARVAALEGRTP